jgi:replication factor C small subunit
MNWIEKYRPQTFTEMVGLNEVLTAIESFILSGDIPHLLFYGEAGTGKTTTAHIIAHKLLGEYFEANFIELNASDTREEGDMRKRVIRALKHKPIGSDIRVILLDEADGLKPTAQDILKRPIEKTRNTVFIFACNDINGIIKPIKSRCALFEFKRISEADTVEGLKRVAVKEKVSIQDDVLRNIARKVDGDMRAAVNELQKMAALNNRNSEIDKIVQQYMKNESVTIKT